MMEEKNHNCKCKDEHDHEEYHECGCGSHEEAHECGCHSDEETHECGCGCHSRDDMEMMYLSLSDGRELACKVIGIFDVEDKEYIALLPENEESVYLYGYQEDEEGVALSRIESEEEYKVVSQTFLKLCE